MMQPGAWIAKCGSHTPEPPTLLPRIAEPRLASATRVSQIGYSLLLFKYTGAIHDLHDFIEQGRVGNPFAQHLPGRRCFCQTVTCS